MRVLLVDDDPLTLSAHQRTLADYFEIDQATSGEAGLEAVRDHGPYTVVVADMNMPGISGLEFLIEIGRRAPETTRIMLTGVENQKTAADAVNSGRVFRFLSKPCALETLLQAVRDGAAHYQQIHRERELLEQTFNGIVQMLTETLSAADPEAFALGQRLRDRAQRIGRALNLTCTWELETAALLLRIGMVTIPDAVRQKARAGEELKGPEVDLLQRIPTIGASLLEHIPRMAMVADFIRYQEKQFDGNGFPQASIRGEEIPIGSRILRALVDLDNATAGGIAPSLAFAALRKNAGFYDPEVLDALGQLLDAPAPDDGHTPLAADLLRPGMVLAEPVLTNEGTVLVGSDTRLTPMLLERLRNFAELDQLRIPVVVRSEYSSVNV